MRESSWIQEFIHGMLFCFGAVLIAIIIIPVAFIIYPLWLMYEALFGREIGKSTVSVPNRNEPM